MQAPAAQRALLDERERRQAAVDDGALVSYQRKWELKLRRLQRAHPARWRVAGLSEEEVRDALTLRLIEAVRGGAEPEPGTEGKEWGLTVVERALRGLRKSFRLEATPMDFRAVSLEERVPTQEQRYLDDEASVARSIARQRAREQLSQPQRRWLAALSLAAMQGEFFQTSDRVNLSAASRMLGKDRSSAQRAYRALQTCFQRELERLR